MTALLFIYYNHRVGHQTQGKCYLQLNSFGTVLIVLVKPSRNGHCSCFPWFDRLGSGIRMISLLFLAHLGCSLRKHASLGFHYSGGRFHLCILCGAQLAFQMTFLAKIQISGSFHGSCILKITHRRPETASADLVKVVRLARD